MAASGTLFGQPGSHGGGDKLLFILTNHSAMGVVDSVTGFYLPEAAHPWKVAKDKGFQIVFASPLGGEVPVDKSSLANLAKDAVCREFWEDASVQAQLKSTFKVAQAVSDFSGLRGIFFVGGHGPMWDVIHSPDCIDAVARFYKAGGVVGAVCHGPAALVNMYVDGRPILEGKEVTGFSNEEETQMKFTNVVPFLLEDRLKARGGVFKKAAEPWGECVCASERLVTGQNPASAGPVLERMIQCIRA